MQPLVRQTWSGKESFQICLANLKITEGKEIHYPIRTWVSLLFSFFLVYFKSNCLLKWGSKGYYCRFLLHFEGLWSCKHKECNERFHAIISSQGLQAKKRKGKLPSPEMAFLSLKVMWKHWIPLGPIWILCLIYCYMYFEKGKVYNDLFVVRKAVFLALAARLELPQGSSFDFVSCRVYTAIQGPSHRCTATVVFSVASQATLAEKYQQQNLIHQLCKTMDDSSYLPTQVMAYFPMESWDMDRLLQRQPEQRFSSASHPAKTPAALQIYPRNHLGFKQSYSQDSEFSEFSSVPNMLYRGNPRMSVMVKPLWRGQLFRQEQKKRDFKEYTRWVI